MRIGLYGMPTAGKTYILDKVDSVSYTHLTLPTIA